MQYGVIKFAFGASKIFSSQSRKALPLNTESLGLQSTML